MNFAYCSMYPVRGVTYRAPKMDEELGQELVGKDWIEQHLKNLGTTLKLNDITDLWIPGYYYYLSNSLPSSSPKSSPNSSVNFSYKSSPESWPNSSSFAQGVCYRAEGILLYILTINFTQYYTMNINFTPFYTNDYVFEMKNIIQYSIFLSVLIQPTVNFFVC